jgi:hypothetical protein
MGELLYEGRDLEVLANMPNYYSWIMDTFAPHITGHVVEYGAGAGTVSSRLVPLAAKLTLVEPSVNLVSVLRRRFQTLPGRGGRRLLGRACDPNGQSVSRRIERVGCPPFGKNLILVATKKAAI